MILLNKPKGGGGATIMDYVTIIVDAIVAFVKEFDINAVVKAFGDIDWNGVKDAVVSVFASLEKLF